MLSVPFTFSTHNWWPDIVVARRFSRGNREPRHDRPRGKMWQRGKLPHRQHDKEVLCMYADLNANSLVWRAFFPYSRPPLVLGRSTRSHTTKLIARCEKQNALLPKQEYENAIERDRVELLSLFLSLPILVFPRILFICVRAYTILPILHICSLIFLMIWKNADWYRDVSSELNRNSAFAFLQNPRSKLSLKIKQKN